MQSLTYGELDARANQLAHHLRALGVGPEAVVGLCVERSPEMLIGLIGILKAGGAYLPLDPSYPHERLAFMLEDAGAPVLVTAVGALDRLPAHGARIVRLDADWPAIAAQPIDRTRRWRSTRTTPPTSSTPRDPPEGRKAWWVLTMQCANRIAAQIAIAPFAQDDVVLSEDVDRIRRLDIRRSLGPLLHGASLWLLRRYCE